MPTDYPLLHLKPREEKRLHAGHLWVYSNEVDTRKSPLKRFGPGDKVLVVSSSRKVLGVAYINPKSLICARILTTDVDQCPEEELIGKRLQQAFKRREQYFSDSCYRAVFAEGDLLPGLVIDRFGPHLVGQISTAGMEMHRQVLEKALVKIPGVESLLWRNDINIRQREGLAPFIEQGFGQTPEKLDVNEAGTLFKVSAREGQKTGWFYDQRSNRDKLMPYVNGQCVLDLFSYAGGWALRSLKAGASSALCVDSSASACDECKENARLNLVEDQLETRQSRVDEFLQQAAADGFQWDIVVADPPAFIKRKKDLGDGVRAYGKLAKQSLDVLKPGGLLVFCSCSQHMSAEQLRRTVSKAASRAGRSLQIIEFLHQGPDHPVHPAIPETEYLKGYIFREVDA